MNDDLHDLPPDGPSATQDDAAPAGVAVPMGPAQPQDLPVLQTMAAPVTEQALAVAHSTVGAGMSFVGEVVHPGLFTLAGELRGSVDVGEGQLTITESGRLDGDAHARTIAVFGQSHGTLDAAGGRVALHDSAIVTGKVRYAHLQVNGADLNAQLERAQDERAARTTN